MTLQPIGDPQRLFKYEVMPYNIVVYKSGGKVVVTDSTGFILAEGTELGEPLMYAIGKVVDKQLSEGGTVAVSVGIQPGSYQLNNPIAIIDLPYASGLQYSYIGIEGVGARPYINASGEAILIRNSGIGYNWYQGMATLKNLYITCGGGDVCVEVQNVALIHIDGIYAAGNYVNIGMLFDVNASGAHQNFIGNIRYDGSQQIAIAVLGDIKVALQLMAGFYSKQAFLLDTAAVIYYLHTLDEPYNGAPPPVIVGNGAWIENVLRESLPTALTYIWHDRNNTNVFIGNYFSCCHNSSYDLDKYIAYMPTTPRSITDGWYSLYIARHTYSLNGASYLLSNMIPSQDGVYRFGGIMINDANTITDKWGFAISQRGVDWIQPVGFAGGVPVTVSAGGTAVIAQLVIPSGQSLRVSYIMPLYNPSGTVVAQIYNVGSASVVVSTSTYTNTGWEIPGPATIAFQLVNQSTAAANTAAYLFAFSVG